MIRKYLLLILGFLVLLLGVYIVYANPKKIKAAPILFYPAKSPYKHSIAAVGMIEASSENIAISTPFDEIVKKVTCAEGDFVKAGDVLFELETKELTAKYETALASIKLAEVILQNKKEHYAFYERLKNKRAVSEQIYKEVYYAYLEAEASVEVAKKNLNEIKVNIERSTISAPIDGKILQVNIHPGEIAPKIPFISAQSLWSTAANGVLILMGRVDPLELRIDIDEDDVWRFVKGSPAIAYVRGNKEISFPLKYVNVSPYMIPKESFTGGLVERIDTRVLQVIYEFDKGDLPLYTGQVVDVFIESKPLKSPS